MFLLLLPGLTRAQEAPEEEPRIPTNGEVILFGAAGFGAMFFGLGEASRIGAKTNLEYLMNPEEDALSWDTRVHLYKIHRDTALRLNVMAGFAILAGGVGYFADQIIRTNKRVKALEEEETDSVDPYSVMLTPLTLEASPVIASGVTVYF